MISATKRLPALFRNVSDVPLRMIFLQHPVRVFYLPLDVQRLLAI
jgi:hypothetical protein